MTLGLPTADMREITGKMSLNEAILGVITTEGTHHIGETTIDTKETIEGQETTRQATAMVWKCIGRRERVDTAAIG